MSGTSFAVLLLALGACACSDGASRYATHDLPREARAEGELDLYYAWLDSATLAVVAPYHASALRADYTRQQLDHWLSGDGRPSGDVRARLYLALAVYRFEPREPPLELGADGVAFRAVTPRGKVESIRPSKVLEPVTEPGRRKLLEAVAGAGRLPSLVGGHVVQLLEVLPAEAGAGAFESAALALPDRDVALTKLHASAQRWDEFRSQPSRQRFESVLGKAPVDETAEHGKEGAHTGDRNDERDGEH